MASPSAPPAWSDSATSGISQSKSTMHDTEKLPLASAIEVVLPDDSASTTTYYAETLVSDTAERAARKKARLEQRRDWHIASLVLTVIIVGLIIAAALVHDSETRRTLLIAAGFA